MRFLLITVLFISPTLFSIANVKPEDTFSSFDRKPLILQWEVSHLRNRDQISLIFRQQSVELVTNTSSYQKGRIVRLGHFQSPLNPKLKVMRGQIQQYYIQLKETIPLSSLIKDPRFQPPIDPHAPVLRINEEKIQSQQTHFKPLAQLIYSVWDRKWTCVNCVLYEKQKKSIVRTTKKMKSELKTKIPYKVNNEAIKKWETTKQTFSKQQLDCVQKSKNKVECIDPQFGIFEI